MVLQTSLVLGLTPLTLLRTGFSFSWSVVSVSDLVGKRLTFQLESSSWWSWRLWESVSVSFWESGMLYRIFWGPLQLLVNDGEGAFFAV